MRDLGLLESSLARPRSGYYDTPSEQGAARLQSHARNHVFVDGNERVAVATCAVFLRMNGFVLELPPAAAERFLIDRVIACHAELDEITRWLEGAMRPL